MTLLGLLVTTSVMSFKPAPTPPEVTPSSVLRGPYIIGSARPVPIPTCWNAKLFPVGKTVRPGNGAKVPCKNGK
jgi:hypothetical protein